MTFKDKVVIVTGASSGIGAAVAIAFSAEGASVVIVGRNEDKLAATAAQCTNALVIRADITKDDEARGVIDQTIQKHGKIDILVNNAGRMVLANIFDDNVVTAFDSVISLNLRAVLRMTSLAIPYLKKTKGNIVNISSVAGCSTQLAPEMLTYCVSKAGLTHLGALLAADLAQHQVRVNTISPGPATTDLIENCQFPGKWDDLIPYTALGKLSEPNEVADFVLFVASDKAKSITGSNFCCDNGWLIKRY